MNYFLATDRPRAEAMAAAIEQHRAQLASCRSDDGFAGAALWSGAARRAVACGHALVVRRLVPRIAGTCIISFRLPLTRGIVRLVKHPGRTTIAQNRLMIGLPIYGLWYASRVAGCSRHRRACGSHGCGRPDAGRGCDGAALRVARAPCGSRLVARIENVFTRPRLRRLRFAQAELRRQLTALAHGISRESGFLDCRMRKEA